MDQADHTTRSGNSSDSNAPASGERTQATNGDRARIAGDSVTTDDAPTAAPTKVSERIARQRMIAMQREIWVDGLLKKSLWDEVLSTLGAPPHDRARQRPYDLVQRTDTLTDQPLPADTRISSLYDAFQGSLLILGAPGSGKTTLLLELLRDLLDRADADDSHPIPVRFDLSEWGSDQTPMKEWLAEQLTRQYRVPRKLATVWIAEGTILPLFDELDGVAVEWRTRCVDVINRYEEARTSRPSVVCCSERAYAKLPHLRRLGTVIAQPLSEAQVEAYLARGGARLAGVRALIAAESERDPWLATPLMLSITALAYADEPQVQLQGTTPAARSAEVVDHYINQALRREPQNARFLQETTRQHLEWLAWQLQRSQQSALFMEGMQPVWAGYAWLQRLIIGLIVGIIIGGVVGINSEPRNALEGGLLFGLVSGVIVLLTSGKIKTVDRTRWSWSAAQSAVREKLGTVLQVGLVSGFVYTLQGGISAGIGRALLFGIGAGIITVVATVLFHGLVGGFHTSGTIPTHAKPNAGITAPAIEALIFGLGAGLLGGLSAGLGKSLNAGLVGGVILGMITGLACGQQSLLQHAILRVFLVIRNMMPLNIAAFCDECAERGLLRRIGSGWIFVHPVLQEHLAAQYEAAQAAQDVERSPPA